MPVYLSHSGTHTLDKFQRTSLSWPGYLGVHFAVELLESSGLVIRHLLLYHLEILVHINVWQWYHRPLPYFLDGFC